MAEEVKNYNKQSGTVDAQLQEAAAVSATQKAKIDELAGALAAALSNSHVRIKPQIALY